jgi:ketosteroid isomerase-like protein
MQTQNVVNTPKENENVTKLKKAYAFWNDNLGKSNQQWMDLMDDNVVFRSLAGGAQGMEFTLDCSGKNELQRYFAGLAEDWEMIHYTPDEFIADGDRVVVLAHTAWKSRKTGKSVETPKADIFRFKNGKVVDFYEFYDTYRCIAAGL